MPLYTFENTETGEHFEKQMKIAEREDYLSANPHIRQTITKAPSMGDPHRMGVIRTPDSFNSLMKNIHKNNLGSKIQTR
jgi:NADPH-dependent curcumin reductase CurA